MSKLDEIQARLVEADEPFSHYDAGWASLYAQDVEWLLEELRHTKAALDASLSRQLRTCQRPRGTCALHP